MARRFPPPWSVEDIGGCFAVKASNGRPLIFIYYGEGERTLERLRVAGTGPRFVRIGKYIRYQPSALEAFVASRVVGSTSEDIHERT